MGQGRIVIVDHDEDWVKSLSAMLSDAGYKVSATADGGEALTLVRTVAPAVILLDIWVPGMDGVAIMQALRALHAEVAVIAVSGHGNIATAVQMLKLGACDYLEKPVSWSKVLRAIEHARAQRGPWHQPSLQPAVAGPMTDLLREAPTRHAVYGQTGGPLSCAALQAQRWDAVDSRRQRTLRRSLVLYGQGLQSGLKTGLILSPLPPYSGVLFRNITTGKTVPASVDCVESTDFCTSLKHDCTTARTVEHLMSALHAYGITNVLITISDEVPIMDGSAYAFCQLIEDAGVAEQDAVVEELVVDRRYAIGQVSPETKFILVEPYDGFRVTYRLDYPPPLGVQECSYEHRDSSSYRDAIAPARTFAFVKDVERMHELGLIAGGRFTNVVLIGEEKVINSGALRFPDECVRHKILDIIGDLYLLGKRLRGHVRANMTGHTENIALVRKLQAVLSHARA